MKRYLSLVLSLVLLLSVGFVGESIAEEKPQVTLTFATSLYVEEPHQKVLDRLLEMYKEVAPNVNIEIYGAGYANYWDNMTTEVMAGNEADIMQMYPDNVATYHALRPNGTFISLDSYLEGGPLKELLIGQDACVFDGQTLALSSYAYGTTGLFYRKSMLEEAGIDPATLLTWDDFKAASKLLTHDDKYAMGILTSSHAFVVSEWVRQLARIPSNGFYFTDGEIGPYTAERINVNSDAVKWAAKEWQDYLLVDKCGKPAPDKKDSREYFWHGVAAFNHDGPWFIGMTEAAYPDLMDDIGLIPVPAVVYEGETYKANPSNYPIVSSISSNCENPQEAFDFLAWMASEEAQRVVADCGMIPSNREFSSSEEYAKDHALATVFNSFIGNQYDKLVNDPPIAQLQALQQVMIDATQAMFAGGEDVSTTLDEAAEACKDIMNK